MENSEPTRAQLEQQLRESNAGLIYCTAIAIGIVAAAFGWYWALPVIFGVAIMIDCTRK